MATFKENNRKIIGRFPALKPAPEPVFTPASPAREWSDAVEAQPPSAEVRAMLGLQPGESVPPAHWERQPDSGHIKIRDLDED